MKRQIRRGVFETNSSSVHSLTVCTKEEYEKWKDDEIFFDDWEEKFVSLEKLQLTDKEKKDIEDEYNRKKQKYWKEWNDLSEEEKGELYVKKLKELRGDDRFMNWDDYRDGYLDFYQYNYTSPSGDELVIFGKYGYDG